LVSIVGDAPDKIVAVTANVLRMDAQVGPLTTKWLSFAAGLPYQGAVPAQAGEWVAEHMSRGGSMVVGDVRFTIYGPAESPTLEITPAWRVIAGPHGSCSQDAHDCGS
jgi:hypothetical protein